MTNLTISHYISPNPRRSVLSHDIHTFYETDRNITDLLRKCSFGRGFHGKIFLAVIFSWVEFFCRF